MRGHVSITQDVGLRLQIFQTVLDHITDADDTGQLAVAQHGHVAHAMTRHKLHHATDTLVLGEAPLRWILGEFVAYYNKSRTHRALSQDAPVHRAIERLGAITSRPVLGGLHHQYCRI
jgi:hypothetical protein